VRAAVLAGPIERGVGAPPARRNSRTNDPIAFSETNLITVIGASSFAHSPQNNKEVKK